jgi:hypothetical protein
MKNGTTTLKNVKIGSTQIQKVMHGVKLVWENWVKKTGTIYKLTSQVSCSGVEASKAGSILKYGKPIRKPSGSITIKGAGGESGMAQYGYTVVGFLDETYTDDRTNGKSVHLLSGHVNTTVATTKTFNYTQDKLIYGIRYEVWTWNGGSGTSTSTMTAGSITSWEEKGA